MGKTKILYTVQMLYVEHRSVQTDQPVIQGALPADTKATFHVSFQAQLTRDVLFAAHPVKSDEHWLGATGKDGGLVGRLCDSLDDQVGDVTSVAKRPIVGSKGQTRTQCLALFHVWQVESCASSQGDSGGPILFKGLGGQEVERPYAVSPADQQGGPVPVV